MRVLTFVNRASSTSIPLDIAEAIEVHTEAEVTVASLFDNDPASFDPDVANLAVEIVPLGAESRFDLSAYRDLRSMLEASFDALHTHHNSTGSLARAFSVPDGVAVVDTEHNDHRHFSTLQNVVNAVTLPAADAVVSNSAHTRDSFRWYERPFVRSNSVHMVYNGVDFDRIREGRSLEPPLPLPDGPVVCNVGVMTSQKCQETLLRAMERVLRDVPDASLVVVGDGPRRDRLESVAVELGLDRNVVFTGYLPTREQVYSVLGASDVFVLSSRYEGFCVALVEAMACELPFVASDIPVLHEVGGECGLFAPVGSVEAFANRIVELLEAPDTSKRLGNRGRRRALQRFPIERTARRYYEIYEEVRNLL